MGAPRAAGQGGGSHTSRPARRFARVHLPRIGEEIVGWSFKACQVILQPVFSGGRKALVAATTSAKSFLSFMADLALPSIR